MFLYLTLYIQNILGYSALQSGLRFMPVTLLSFAIAPAAGKLAERLGVRWFLAGGLVATGIGLLWMTAVSPGDKWTVLLPGFLVAGLGTGLVNPALATAAIGVVDAKRAGMASGINSTFRQVGIATGIAVWGAIFEHKAVSSFEATMHRPGNSNLILFGGGRVPGVEAAFIAGLDLILVLAAIIAFIGAALSAVLIRRRDFVTAEPGEERVAVPAH
jgi:MFS family permease